jgi:hypothetical protein
MTLRIEIAMDTAAFADLDADSGAEVVRILRTLATAIERNDRVSDYVLRDSDGKRVGVAEVVES